MRELNQRLHDLGHAGSGPLLPAGEIRRLGDRRRRRRQGAAVMAAAAAVAAVVVPLVLTGSGPLGTAPPAPAAPTTSVSPRSRRPRR